MNAFLARLLFIAALAIAPAVDGALHQYPVIASDGSVPQTAAPSQHTTSPRPTRGPIVSDRQRAIDIVDRYEAALIAGRWQAAFDLLAPTSLTSGMGLDAFAYERAPFFESVGDRYVLLDPARVTDWAFYAPVVSGADRAHAWLIEVDYPALSNNNAGWEQFLAAPDSGGTWRIWPVR